MNINLITPAAKHSRSGNRVTAERWQALLSALDHRVRVVEHFDEHACDCLIAIHAYRSADAIAGFRASHPELALIVLLAGTDIYRFSKSHPLPTLASMEAADRLVGLHERVHQDIPARFVSKLRIILQSAQAAEPAVPTSTRASFDVCVVGHLREEKDPLRAALAARLAGPESRLAVTHLGKAHSEAWEKAAHDEMARNPRYVWRGEVSPEAVRSHMAGSDVMVISSIMEGGANVVSEAVVAGLPVLASRISGNVGLLGADYPGYYETGDTRALYALLARGEQSPAFLAELRNRLRARAPLFSAAREREAWRLLLTEI